MYVAFAVQGIRAAYRHGFAFILYPPPFPAGERNWSATVSATFLAFKARNLLIQPLMRLCYTVCLHLPSPFRIFSTASHGVSSVMPNSFFRFNLSSFRFRCSLSRCFIRLFLGNSIPPSCWNCHGKRIIFIQFCFQY